MTTVTSPENSQTSTSPRDTLQLAQPHNRCCGRAIKEIKKIATDVQNSLIKSIFFHYVQIMILASVITIAPVVAPIFTYFGAIVGIGFIVQVFDRYQCSCMEDLKKITYRLFAGSHLTPAASKFRRTIIDIILLTVVTLSLFLPVPVIYLHLANAIIGIFYGLILNQQHVRYSLEKNNKLQPIES